MACQKKSTATDVYTIVTDRIIAEMESGIIPWQKPWTGSNAGAISHVTGRPYSLLNQMLLVNPGEYITFKQCEAEGGRVKKGSKSKMIVFWKFIQKQKVDPDGNPVKDKVGMPVMESIPYLRYFNVFHINDCEGIAPKYDGDAAPKTIDPVADAERVIDDYIRRSGVTLEHCCQNEAYYSPSRDLIRMPLMEQFLDVGGYYDTLFHEATHSTGHKSRLNRFELDSAEAASGRMEYSKEELVAEIGSSAIMHELGMESPKTIKNAAGYIQSWLRVLKNDNRFIVSAAGKAEKAVALIMNKVSNEE